MRRLFVLGALSCVVLLLAGTGQALARHKPGKPGYHALHPTRVTEQTGWAVSYNGSSSWSVIETGSTSNGDSSSDDESSRESWNFGVPKDSAGATGLIVDFPTLCRVVHSYPCPSPMVSLAGAGPSSLTFNIDDVLTSPGSPTQEVNCAGAGDADAAGGGGVKMFYVKADNSYRVEPLGGPAASTALTQSAESDPNCPGPNTEGVPISGDWSPGVLPSGSGPMPQNYGVGKSVLIPAGEFAKYSEIEIPVSLLPINAPPEDCGMAASSGEHCDVTSSWSGIITLHRVSHG